MKYNLNTTLKMGKMLNFYKKILKIYTKYLDVYKNKVMFVSKNKTTYCPP